MRFFTTAATRARHRRATNNGAPRLRKEILLLLHEPRGPSVPKHPRAQQKNGHAPFSERQSKQLPPLPFPWQRRSWESLRGRKVGASDTTKTARVIRFIKNINTFRGSLERLDVYIFRVVLSLRCSSLLTRVCAATNFPRKVGGRQWEQCRCISFIFTYLLL